MGGEKTLARRITVTPELLMSASEKIEMLVLDYQKVYTKLYAEIGSMKSAWDGADNVAFTTQVQGFEDDFQLMYKLMLEYASFLRMSAKAYKQTQEDIISAAGGLSTGVGSMGNLVAYTDQRIHQMVGPGGQLDREALFKDMLDNIDFQQSN